MEWVFIIPSGDLGKKISGSQYSMVIVIQNLQLFTLSIMQCISDGFYMTVTLHLTGQLKILKAKFKTLASKPDTVENNRKHLSRLVDRHCELAKFNQNIEDTFHLIILLQLIVVTLLLALMGTISLCMTR